MSYDELMGCRASAETAPEMLDEDMWIRQHLTSSGGVRHTTRCKPYIVAFANGYAVSMRSDLHKPCQQLWLDCPSTGISSEGKDVKHYELCLNDATAYAARPRQVTKTVGTSNVSSETWSDRVFKQG